MGLFSQNEQHFELFLRKENERIRIWNVISIQNDACYLISFSKYMDIWCV